MLFSDASKLYFGSTSIQKVILNAATVWNSDPLPGLIATLFGASEEGGLWLPGLDTCYTDNGTTLCTGAGNLVYRINDLSGNGYHAIQATVAARPALGRTVEGGRRNVFTNTQNRFHVSNPYNNSGLTLTADQPDAPDGTSTATLCDDGSGTGITHAVFYVGANMFNITTGANWTLSCYVKNVDGRYVNLAIRTGTNAALQGFYATFDLQDGTVARSGAAGSGSSLTSAVITAVGGGWYRCSITGIFGADNDGRNFFITTWDGSAAINTNYLLSVFNGNNRKIIIWGTQLELSSSLSDYQRVGTTSLDVTEAGKEELWFLRDDGVDDALVATFASALGDECTTNIADSEGIDTLTAQTVGTTYDILQSTDVFGAIVVDRALTAGEQDQVDAYLGALHP